MEGSNIDQSLLFGENVYEQEYDAQEQEENRRIQIENMIYNGKLDGILGEEDLSFSDEDEASEEEEQNTSVTSSASLHADIEDHFANMDRMPASYEELFNAYKNLEILYKIRGSKLEETTKSAAAIQEEFFGQMQAMNHRLNLADKQCEDLRKQNEALNEKHKDDEKCLQEAVKQQKDIQTAIGELVCKNTTLDAKLVELEQDVENLNFQITQQQKNGTIETITKRYEMAIEQMRDQHSKDAQTSNQETLISLSEQLKSSIKIAEELSALRERLEYENGQLKMKISAKDQQIEQLTMRCQELEQNVESLKKWSELSKQPNQQSDATTIGTLTKEFEHDVESQVKKRAECTSIRAQLVIPFNRCESRSEFPPSFDSSDK